MLTFALCPIHAHKHIQDQGQTERLHKLEHELEDLIKESKKKEQNLRKKKLKTEKEVENWINKYDVEMTEKATEITAISVITYCCCCCCCCVQLLKRVVVCGVVVVWGCGGVVCVVIR